MTGGYAASYLSWFLIPFVCWLLPILVLGLVFLHIESDA